MGSQTTPDTEEVEEDEESLSAEERAAVLKAGQGAPAGPSSSRNTAANASDPNRVLTVGEMQKLIERDRQRAQLAAAQVEQQRQLRQHISHRISQHPALAGDERKREQVLSEVIRGVPRHPDLPKAQTHEDFFAILDKVTDQEIDTEVKTARRISGLTADEAGQRMMDQKQAALLAGASVGPGSTERRDSGTNDKLDSLIFGLGIEQPSQTDLQEAHRRELRSFADKYKVKLLS